MIYFVCDNNLHFFIDYINSIKYNYNDVEIIQDIYGVYNRIGFSKKDIFIFIQRIPLIETEILNKLNYYTLNTEQLSKEEWVSYFTSTDVKIVDYSMANIQCLLHYRNDMYYLPYMVNKNEIFDYEKIYDIAVIGYWTDSYRLNITNNIPNINIIEGFDRERDEKLFRHKILLNIHFNERFKIFEQMRCNRCILNKMIVITERSMDIDYELKEYIIECEYNELISKTKDVLENYDVYHNKLFSNFDIDKIEKMYKRIGDETIELLKKNI